jgi:hypothetical protein
MTHMPRTFAACLLGCLLAGTGAGLTITTAGAQGSRMPEGAAAAPAKPATPRLMRPLVAPEPKEGEPVPPARQPECSWLGQRIVSLLWRDDVNTAREQSRFYDRFGCPADHLKLAFRCVIRQSERQPEQTDLNARIYGCWMSPEIGEPSRR